MSNKNRKLAHSKPVVSNVGLNTNLPPAKNVTALNQLIARRDKLLADAETLLKAIEFLKSES